MRALRLSLALSLFAFSLLASLSAIADTYTCGLSPSGYPITQQTPCTTSPNVSVQTTRQQAPRQQTSADAYLERLMAEEERLRNTGNLTDAMKAAGLRRQIGRLTGGGGHASRQDIDDDARQRDAQRDALRRQQDLADRAAQRR
jgi:hypothetical protein